MEQLELRFYTREEIAEVLSMSVKRNNFGRDVRDKLSKWGYGCHYQKRVGVDVFSKPETTEERLAELLIREYCIDVQINPMQFAYFITSFKVIDGFNSMPWAERAAAYYKQFNIWVSDRTMRNWCSRLIQKGVIHNFGACTAWRTDIIDGRKCRSQVQEEEEEEMNRFFDRRWELVKEYQQDEREKRESIQEAKKKAWSRAYKELWSEFSCCYYYCKDFVLTAFTDDDKDTLYEIYELVEELAAVPLPPAKNIFKEPTTKEEFFKEWGFQQ